MAPPLETVGREQRGARRRVAPGIRRELADPARDVEDRTLERDADRAEHLMTDLRGADRRARRREARRARRGERLGSRRLAPARSKRKAAARARVAAPASCTQPSASGCATAWNSPIARPNCLRVRACSAAVLDQPGPGGGEIGGERDVVERERAAGVAERRACAPARARPQGSPPSVSTGSIAPRGRARCADSPSISTKSCAAGAHASSGGRPSETTASPRTTAARSRGGSSCAAQMLAASGPGKTARPSASTAATSSQAPPSPSGVARASTPSSAIAFQSPESESARRRAFTTASLQRSRQSWLARVVDRLLRVVEVEVEAHYFRHQRSSATARRWPATPPASSRSAGRRMLQTCRSCSRVKPMAPVN